MPAINIIKHLIKETGIGLGSGEQCYDIMYSIVRAFQVKTLVEIGTYKAYSTIVMCQAILDNHLPPTIYTADQWNNYGMDISEVEKVARKNISQMNFNNYINIIKGDSKVTISALFKKVEKVDMCFIDGDHTLEGVRTDWTNCQKHTNLILFHDALWNQEMIDFLHFIESEYNWKNITFPTRYSEGDNHEIGIALAIKNK